MKFKIRDEQAVDSVVELWLARDADGCPTLYARKENGQANAVLSIESGGDVLRWMDVDPDLGFSLDADGSIVIADHERTPQ